MKRVESGESEESREWRESRVKREKRERGKKFSSKKKMLSSGSGEVEK